MSVYIWPFILESEYRCQHCGEFPPFFNKDIIPLPMRELFQSFQRARELYGKPVSLTGYRCPVHNRNERGEYLSAHMFGVALDADLPSVDAVECFYSHLNKTNPDLRIGKYTSKYIDSLGMKKRQSFIHIDAAYMITPRASEKWVRGARWNK